MLRSITTGTRPAVHTSACARRRDGNSTRRAGLSRINPSRIAPFNAARNVVRMCAGSLQPHRLKITPSLATTTPQSITAGLVTSTVISIKNGHDR